MASWFTIAGVLFFWILLLSVTFAHRYGSDISACSDMRPMHEGDPQPQTTEAPFTVTLHKTHLASNEQLRITLAVQPAGPVDSFKGFLIQLRAVGGAIPALGTFDRNADGTTKVLDCIFGFTLLTRSAITHSVNKPKMTMTVTWNPPRERESKAYEVYYTVVQKEDTFWVKVLHPQKVTVAASVDVGNGVSVSPKMLIKLRKIYGRCGTGNHGCFGVPKACVARFDSTAKEPEICDMIVTWTKEDQIQNDFYIVSKLIGHEISGYVALGVSKDNQMGNDSVAGCIFPADGSQPTVRRFYNTIDRSNELYLNGRYGVHVYEMINVDGLMFCGFTQSDHKIYGEIIDFSNKYFLLLARGITFTAKGLGVHPRIIDRAITETAIRVTKEHDVIESRQELNQLVFLHGAIMLFTWFVVAPTGAFTARYYKLTRVDHLIWGKDFWYATHVIWMVATCTLTLIGAILIFARKDWKFDSRYYHNIMGLVLNVFLLFQVVLAFLWPHSSENYRKVFQWIHFIVGIFLNYTAIACVFLVTDIRLVNIEKKHLSHGPLWNIFSIVIIVLQVLMHLIMTFHTYWADGEMKVDDELICRAITIGPLNSNGLFTEQPGRRFRYLMLLSYISISVVSVIVLMFLIFL